MAHAKRDPAGARVVAGARVARYGVALALAIALGAGVAQVPSETIEANAPLLVIDTEDGPRTYRLTVPSAGASGAEAPALVLALHGNGGSGSRIARAAGFDEWADREGFVVAYPDGLQGSWNYVRGVPGYPEAPDDTAFLRSLVERVQAAHGTDPARTYVVGYSNGGFMAQRLLCEAPDVVAGAVSVSAAGFAGLEGLCASAPPRSLALIHGTADANVPWEGLPVSVPGGTVLITWPVPTTFAWWAERAGCRPPAERTTFPRDPMLQATSITVLALQVCADGHRVSLYALVGGGHAWPRGATFDAAREAWRFLQPVSLD